MRGNSTIDRVVAVLKELGGYFVFYADSGEEFIITAKKDLPRLLAKTDEVQLVLPPTPQQSPRTNLLLEKINRDIALYHAAQEEGYDDIGIDAVANNTQSEATPPPPPRRVRFEPLRGDLPPELQE